MRELLGITGVFGIMLAIAGIMTTAIVLIINYQLAQ